MGVSSVHSINIVDGRSGQQVVDTICKQVESLGGRKCGQFVVECDTYYSSPNISPPRVLYLYHSSDHPASCFALLDNSTSLVADNTLDLIMLNMNGIYSCKKVARMDCRGPKYSLADFVIKVGSCSVGPSFRGVLVEIEYGPCLVPNNCWDLMKEMAQGFLGASVTQPHQYLQGRMNEIFTPLDVIHQYNDHFNALRKVISSNAPANPPTSK